MSQLAREVILGKSASINEPQDFTRQTTSQRAPATSGPRIRADALDVEAQPAQEVTQPEDQSQPLISSKETDTFSKRVRLGINASWFVNVLLLVSKTATFWLSGSYAVLASAVDSLVDLLSQAVLAVAEYQAARFHQHFPIGRTRMAELSVLACAAIMFISTALVIRESVGSLWEGLHGHIPLLYVDMFLIVTLSAATALKLALYMYCRALRKNPLMVALSEDHLNDVMSNLAAIAGATVAGHLPRYWWVDPAVAVLFSVIIIRNWLAICWEQGQKMIGLAAPEELIEEVKQVTRDHNPQMQLDRVTAYHHGSHMVVEVEVLLPAAMTVRESHDIALELQHKIEGIENVERAFVHVDYQRRSLEEHKVERNLKLGEKDVMKPLPGYDSAAPTSPGAVAVAAGRLLPELGPGPHHCTLSADVGSDVTAPSALALASVSAASWAGGAGPSCDKR